MQISTAPDCAGTFKVTAGDAFEVKATTARMEEKTIEKKKTDRLESGVRADCLSKQV